MSLATCPPRGACPTLLEPMQTGDGLLARLHLAQPGLTPAQWAGLVEAANVYGNGRIDVSARGNLQIRGLCEENMASLRAVLDGLGIVHESGPVVMISPLAGVDPAEKADTLALAASLHARMATQFDAVRLHPKLSLLIDGAGTFPLEAYSADIRLTAMGQEQWHIALGGTAAEAMSLAIVRTDDVLTICCALLGLLAGQAQLMRMAELLCQEGMASIRQALEPRGIRLEARAPAPPFRQELSTLPDRLAERDFLWFAIPFGQVDTPQGEVLARLLEQFAIADIRPAPGRAMIATGLSTGALSALRSALREAGFIVTADDPRLRLIACTGQPACGSAHFATRLFAMDLLPHMPAKGIVHVSGCPKGCAHPMPAALTLVGLEGGRVAVCSGQARDALARKRLIFPATDIPAILSTFSLVQQSSHS